MDWMNGLIALGGVIVAGLSVYFTYRMRVERYKERVYETQLKATLEAVEALVAVQQIVEKYYVLLKEREELLSESQLFGGFKEEIFPVKEHLKSVVLKYAPIFSSRLFAAFIEYVSYIELATGEMDTNPDYGGTIGRHVAVNAPWEFLAREFVEVVLVARDFLGVTPLQVAIAKTIGRSYEQSGDGAGEERVVQMLRVLLKEYDRPYYY